MSETIDTKIDNLLKEHAEFKRQFQTKSQSLFKEIVKEFFTKNTAITAIRWTQYKPYWNDGDTCEFRVNPPLFTNCPLDKLEYCIWDEEAFEDDFEDELFETLWIESENYLKNKENVNHSALENFNRLITGTVFEDVMFDMFGEHSEVIVTKDGFNVLNYEHE